MACEIPSPMDGDDHHPAVLERVPEDFEIEEDDELVKFDYQRHVWLYTLTVPLTTVLAFAVSTVPLWLSSFSTVRIDEILLPAALWSLSYTLQKHVDRFSLWDSVSAVLRAGIHILLLLSAPYLLRTAHYADFPKPSMHDEAFLWTWMVGLSWAAVEAVVSIRMAYHSMALYAPQPPQLPIEVEEEEDVDEEASIISTNLSLLNTLHKRDELEDAFAGVAFIDIPFFVLALQRIAAVLLSLGMTLLLSATWYPRLTLGYSLGITLICVTLQAILGMLRAPQVRVYVGMVAGVGVFFAGLGIWGVLE